MGLNAKFFAAIRGSALYPDTLPQSAVDGYNAICTAFDGFSGHDHCVDDLAYFFATAYRECTSAINLGIREIGRGAGKAYGKPTGPYNQIYYGRGPVQETWLANYQRSKTRTGIDFVQYPDLMLNPKYGTINMLDGMYNGLFTGKGMRNYIVVGVPTTRAKFKACRAVVNGTDHADEIADHAVLFQTALQLGYDKPVLTTPPVLATTPPPIQQPQRGLFADIRRLFGKSA